MHAGAGGGPSAVRHIYAHRSLPHRPRTMRLLVLGGTQFVGRAVVHSALAEGHTVTLLNRGLTSPTGPQLFGDAVEHLTGDRRGGPDGLSALEGREWDVVVDVAGYLPSEVRASAAALRGKVKLYAFVSSISAYGDTTDERIVAFDAAGLATPSLDEVLAAGGVAEDTPTSWYSNGDPELATEVDQYGPLKATCERICLESFPDAALILRPGYIVGPWDGTGRWIAWPQRVAAGGTVLGYEADTPMQWIDVRDFADFIVQRCVALDADVYNVVGTGDTLAERPTLSDLLEASASVTGSDATFVYADSTFLRRQPEVNYTSLPFFDPTDGINPESSHVESLLSAASNAKAVAAGLKFRSIDDTVRAALEEATPSSSWGMPPKAEADLLQKWQATSRPRL